MELIKKKKEETLNSQVDKKKPPLAGESLRYISSGNQHLAWLPRPQQKVTVIRSRSPDTMLNSALPGMVAIRGSKDSSA